MLRAIIILCGCVVTVLLLLDLSFPSIFSDEPVPIDHAQGTGLAYFFIGLPINIVALLAHIKWKQKLSIKLLTFLINFLPVGALLSFWVIDYFVPIEDW